MANGISWLHLTDLHWGSGSFADSWGSARSKMGADLHGLIEKLGGELDLVLFTGDLTQSASVEQFAGLDAFLDELWALFKGEGCDPKLFAVPGNHDLVRPSGAELQDVAYNLLKDSWSKDFHQKSFWNEAAASPSRDLVRRMFANYAAWWERQADRRLQDHAGLLPGDLSASFVKDGLRLGLVGLNSAFLQMRDGIEESDGVLDVCPSQLNAACGSKGADAWIDAHDLCFLLTHHPASWLVDGGGEFVSEVCNGPERFALHLFGHMHEQRCAELSIQGGQPRRTVQGASLFSKEPWLSGIQRRTRLVSGYSAGRLVRQGSGYAYSLLPRIRQQVGGAYTMVRDPSFEYDSTLHDATRPRPIRPRQVAGGPDAGVLVSSLAVSFGGVAALAGPPRYTDVHDFLKDWLKTYGHRVGQICVKNIAFDMQHTFPCLQTIAARLWPQGIEWRTLFLDHTQERLQHALRSDEEVTLDMAKANERRLSSLLDKKKSELAKNKVVIDARAYSEIPVMHGFLVNDSALIVGICMPDDGYVRTSPYMVFLYDGENSSTDAETALDMRTMFSSWFDRHWTAGRAIHAVPVPPAQPGSSSPAATVPNSIPSSTPSSSVTHAPTHSGTRMGSASGATSGDDAPARNPDLAP